MKKILLGSMAFALAFMFSGCVGASDGMAINTLDNNKVDRYYKQGYVVSQQKCVIDNSSITAIGGAVVGGGAGAVIGNQKGNSVKGGIIGAVVGGIAGLIVGNEIEAYETIIDSQGTLYTAYFEHKIEVKSTLEFTIVGDELKNVNLL